MCENSFSKTQNANSFTLMGRADSPRQEIVMIHVENERVSMYSGHGFIRSGFRQVGVTSLAELDLPH
jgi:hypothetical protein